MINFIDLIYIVYSSPDRQLFTPVWFAGAPDSQPVTAVENGVRGV